MGGIGECLVGREFTLAAGADHVLAPSPPPPPSVWISTPQIHILFLRREETCARYFPIYPTEMTFPGRVSLASFYKLGVVYLYKGFPGGTSGKEPAC